MMADRPLVSIVIPAYNRAATIARALVSAAAQTHRPLEIIVVDDGSTDDTLSAIDTEACPVALTVIALGQNQGVAAARNCGITAARGDFVAFLDSDDEWRADKIERQLAALDSAGLEFGANYSGSATYGEDGTLCGLTRAAAAGDLRLALLEDNLVGSASCVLARRTLLQQIGGFDSSLGACQEWDLWIRLSSHTRFSCVPEPLTLLHLSRTSRISSNGRARLCAHLQLYRTHLRGPFKAGRVDSTRFRANLGAIFMQLGRPDYAAREFTAIWWAKPWSVKRLTLLALARLGAGKARFFRTVAWLERLETRRRPRPGASPAALALLAEPGQPP
jgi:glycosyltransferase involved in cell wall biosynthesis